jgi:hypothetical protein
MLDQDLHSVGKASLVGTWHGSAGRPSNVRVCMCRCSSQPGQPEHGDIRCGVANGQRNRAPVHCLRIDAEVPHQRPEPAPLVDPGRDEVDLRVPGIDLDCVAQVKLTEDVVDKTGRRRNALAATAQAVNTDRVLVGVVDTNRFDGTERAAEPQEIGALSIRNQAAYCAELMVVEGGTVFRDTTREPESRAAVADLGEAPPGHQDWPIAVGEERAEGDRT